MYPSSVRGVAPVRLIACSQIEMDIVPGCEGPSIAVLCSVRVVLRVEPNQLIIHL